MADPGDAAERRRVEAELEELRASVEKYLSGEGQLTSDAATDLAKAVHDLGGHLVDLHRRVEKIEDAQDEWTTRGWIPPSGSDRP